MATDELQTEHHYKPLVCRTCGQPPGTCSHEYSLIATLCPDCNKRLGAPLPDDENENLICDACGKPFTREDGK